MHGKLKDECIIALKVYDQCRQQDCLTPEMLESVFSLEQGECTVDDQVIASEKGAVITVPTGTMDIAVTDFKICKIETDRKQDPFRKKYYNVHVKFVFKFKLAFLDVEENPIIITCNGVEKECIEAGTAFKKTVVLFGSEGSEIAIASNIFSPESNILEAAPYVLVEAKAMLLDAQLDGNGDPAICDCCDGALDEINLTVGLFTIIKLFRLVNLLVESKGFCKPNKCVEISPLNPCEVFDHMQFPFDIFNPPQKEDFREEEEFEIRRPCDEDEYEEMGDED